MNKYYSPSCALSLYKPGLAEKTGQLINSFEETAALNHCCRADPKLPADSLVINVCPGCDWRFSRLYEDVSTITLWEYLVDKDIPLPDHGRKVMSLHDSCSVRGKDGIYNAVRTLLRRMNITVAEPEHNRADSRCCGFTVYGKVSKEEFKEASRRRCTEMPAEDVVVYCVSCMKNLHYGGGKRVHHIMDLLFNEESTFEINDPDIWSAKIGAYIKKHS